MNSIYITLAAALFLLPTGSGAAMKALSLDELLQRADRITIGRVIDKISAIESIKVNEKDGEPIYYTTVFTYFTIAVSEELKAASAEHEVVVRVLGGLHPDGRLYTSNSEAARMEIGEDVVLFLRVGRETDLFKAVVYEVVGEKHGKLRIAGEKGSEIVQPGSESSRLSEDFSASPILYATFRQKVQEKIGNR